MSFVTAINLLFLCQHNFEGNLKTAFSEQSISSFRVTTKLNPCFLRTIFPNIFCEPLLETFVLGCLPNKKCFQNNVFKQLVTK